MECPHCQSKKIIKRGWDRLEKGKPIQRYRCKDCNKCFNERTGTPMSRLRQSILLKEKAVIRLKLMQERRIKSYLPKEFKQPENGSKILNSLDGLQMEKDVMAKNFGS